jgi:hypothetical protein
MSLEFFYLARFSYLQAEVRNGFIRQLLLGEPP